MIRTEERWRRRISAPADRYSSQLLICYPTVNISNDSHDSANSKRLVSKNESKKDIEKVSKHCQSRTFFSGDKVEKLILIE